VSNDGTGNDMDHDTVDDSLTAVYANECRVGQNLIEFIIDFGQRYSEKPPTYHTRIITTPVSMGEFVETMLKALEAHRERIEAAGLEGSDK
jgi:hypothetical protein